jgi:hypothetical protein
MGLKAQQFDAVTPPGGKEKPQACTRKKEGHCTRDTPIDPEPGGSCLSFWMLTLGGP